MAMLAPIEYEDASPQVRAVYDDIRATRGTDFINNFWKVLAHDPGGLARTWAAAKQVMAAGALDPLTKELVYIAVSVTNNCEYCIHSHTAAARAKGMTAEMWTELTRGDGARQPDQPHCERIPDRRRRALSRAARALIARKFTWGVRRLAGVFRRGQRIGCPCSCHRPGCFPVSEWNQT